MKAGELLKSYHLSLTKSRIGLLEILEKSTVPLSERDIEARMYTGCNRTTIYRNLGTFVGKGVVQRILSDDSVKYKLLCRDDKHDHVHFQCRICNRVICLEELLVYDYELPGGYSKIENQFLIVGICKECNHVEENT